jgi:hypothetical protein
VASSQDTVCLQPEAWTPRKQRNELAERATIEAGVSSRS